MKTILKKFLQNQVASGIYKTLSEAINANIEVLIVQTSMAKKRREVIDSEIKKGFEDINEGRVADGMAFIDELIAKYE